MTSKADFRAWVEQARQTDLLALARAATPLHHTGRTLKRGAEYAGPCPRHGGRDGFKVFPEIGKWFCRTCTGDTRFFDAIALHTFIATGDYQPRGQQFTEAVAALVGERPLRSAPRGSTDGSTHFAAHHTEVRPAPRPSLDESDAPPSLAWQTPGWQLVARAEACLWNPAGQAGLAYLRAERHLTDHTLRQWRFGYIPETFYQPFASWGLPLDPARPRGVWVPQGILIPTFTDDGTLWGLHLRRYDKRQGWNVTQQKLPFVSGSRKALWGTQTTDRRVVYLCGGEFDAALAHQLGVLGGGACSLTTGEGSRLSARWLSYLLAADVILVLYDADAAGQAGAWRQVFLKTARAVICPPPPLRAGDKDLTDYVRAGGDLAGWLEQLRQTHLTDDPAALAQRLKGLAPVKVHRRLFYLDLELDYARVAAQAPPPG